MTDPTRGTSKKRGSLQGRKDFSSSEWREEEEERGEEKVALSVKKEEKEGRRKPVVESSPGGTHGLDGKKRKGEGEI